MRGKVPAHQMCHDLRVGLARHLHTGGLEVGAELRVVLDDAVVYERDASGGVRVRVGIFVAGRSVRRPPGVADAGPTRDGMAGQLFVQVLQTPGLLADLEGASSTMATPAESYPRYSRRRSPSTMTSTASFSPTYPTIPHIGRLA
jgi:hypothetical protein